LDIDQEVYLCLNDWESSHRSTALCVAHLGSPLKETGVKVEHITRVGLTTWRTPEQKGHLPVGHGLLGQIVKDDESVHAIVTEELAHGATRIGSQVLQRCGIGSGSRHDNAAKKQQELIFP
jgi:hypothetical protein